MSLRDYLNFPTRQELIDFNNVLAHGQAVAVLGVNNLGDIPQETWYFDENSMAVADNVTVIHPTIIPQNDPGRYHINMVQADWNAMFNKPDLSDVAISGDYNDLTNKIIAGTGILMNSNNEVSVDGSEFVSTSAADSQFAEVQSEIDTKAPLARTVTINGLTQDLSGNRSWQVGNVSTDQSYSNPSWITALTFSKITNVPNFLTEELDPTVPSYVKAITQTQIGNWDGKQNQVIAGSGITKTGDTLAIDTTNVMTVPVANAAIADINTNVNARVPNSRTLTINGVAQDLSANRTWTIAVPTQTSQLTNNSGFLTGITAGQVTTALGITPVDQAGARSAISLTTTGTSGAAVYNSSTGVLNIPNYAVGAPTYNNTPSRTINGAGIQISTTKNTRVTYTITHSIALTLVLTSGSSMVFLEVSPNNSTWTTISQAGYSDGVAVAIALTKTNTNNVQGEVQAGWYMRLRAVTTGAGSAALVNGQEVQY